MSLEKVLQSIIDPKTYVGGLVCDDASALYVKDVTIYDSRTVSNTTVFFLVTNPNDSIYRTTYFAYATGGTLVVTSMFPTAANVALAVKSGFLGALPSNTALSVSPALSPIFDTSRIAALRIRAYSAAISTTSATLNGTGAATAVSSLNNLKDWSVPSMMQASMTPKDGIANVALFQGVEVVGGPDVSTTLEATDASSILKMRQSKIILGAASAAAIPLGLSGGSGLWFSPYYNSSMGYSIGLNELPTIGNSASARFLFSVTTTINAASIAVAAVIGSSSISGGLITTQIMFESMRRVFCAAINGTELISLESIPITPPNGFTVIGFVVYIQPILSGVGIAVDALTPSWVDCDACEPSSVSSYRVIRFDSLVAGQTINIEGVAQVEGVVQGEYATYLKGMRSVGFGNPSTIPLLRVMFNSPDMPFKRVGTADEFAKLKDMIIGMAPTTEAANAIIHAHAAGFLSNFLSKGGTWLGGYLGRKIGGRLDNWFGNEDEDAKTTITAKSSGSMLYPYSYQQRPMYRAGGGFDPIPRLEDNRTDESAFGATTF